MNDKTKLALRMLGIALILGVLGDMLLRALPWGLNLSLWMGSLVVGLIVLGRWQRERLASGGFWLILPLILFSAAFLWRDSPALKMMNMLAILTALSLVILYAQGGRIRLAGIMEYFLGGLISGVNAAFGLLSLLFRDIQWKEFLGARWSERTMAIARGLLFTFPLLLIFGGLFMGADAAFESIVKNALHLNFFNMFKHFFVTAFCAWIVGGYLRGTLLGKELGLAADRRPQVLSLGIIEVGMVLALLDVLFLSFVLVQVRYFFGGASRVQATTGLTYAEYARRGFFELVTVAALVLPLLLFADWLLNKENPVNARIFRALAGAQLLMLFVIMASALQRMRLYQTEYGLTELRLYTTAFMGWLAVVFVWFAATVLRGRRQSFAFGALVAGYLLITILHVLNPDAFIAQVNVARASAGRSFDARYVGSLSADAVPTLVVALPTLSQQDRCAVAARILKSWPLSERPDWRTWSRARSEAWRIVGEKGATLRELSCQQKDN